MIIYFITYFGVALYYMISCAGDDDTANTWSRIALRAAIAFVAAIFWPATMVIWIIRDGRAMFSSSKG